ncbi:MAG TPA: pitrilysin family protein [Candidatus Sulfopaludibacter sp.]|jgi:predicted Zn-dependent peptidase|nr:pitrilysin family protein [Candidatus Sulfopaludibacter sp.]
MMKRVSLALGLLVSGILPAVAADIHVPVDAYKLKNGLRVILSRDNAVPVVTVYMIYDVGSRSEEKGRTGFAHLFEHMMFEGSANAPKGTQFAAVESNGGVLNGSTHPDFTDYYEVLPSNKLATALWLESDRMRSLSITDENLKNQKEAVKQERRLSFDNQPYQTAIVEVWPTLMFQNWQSSHSLIGSFEDLNNSTVADVSKFFKTYYAPDNAALVIVGDIQLDATKKLIETYFGDVPAQPLPKRPDLAEPADFKPVKKVYKDPLAQVPALIIGYPGPKRRSPDYYALHMVDAILTAGDSSRFRMDLVKGKESILQYEAELGFPFASARDYRDPEPYAMFIVHKPNFTSDQIVGQIQDEIAKLQNQPVDAKELERVKTQVRAGTIKEMQSSQSRAEALAQFQLADGDPELINTELDRILAVTPAQIQAAAKKYLTPEKRAVLEIQPAPGPAGKEDK